MRKYNNNRHQNRGKNMHHNSHKARNTAKQQHERYLSLARDAQTSGDRVLAERNFQYADHYYRILTALTPEKPVVDEREKRQSSEGEEEVVSDVVPLNDQPVEVDLADDESAAEKEKPVKKTRRRAPKKEVLQIAPDETSAVESNYEEKSAQAGVDDVSQDVKESTMPRKRRSKKNDEELNE